MHGVVSAVRREQPSPACVPPIDLLIFTDTWRGVSGKEGTTLAVKFQFCASTFVADMLHEPKPRKAGWGERSLRRVASLAS